LAQPSRGAIWTRWRRSTKTEITAPTRQSVKGATAKGNGHAIHWNGDAIKRAAIAIRESYSTDFYVMARRALEAAARNEADLLKLLPPDPEVKPAPTRKRPGLSTRPSHLKT
jgi:hypothetical protein